MQGKTLMIKGDTSMTVLGDAKDRRYAVEALMPVILESVRVLSSLRGSRPVHVTYCNACGDRMLPVIRGEVLTKENVNGGVCMDTGTTRVVLVFRRQDAPKVMVHELLHLFDIDRSLHRMPAAVENQVARPRVGMWAAMGRLNTRVALGEAYTDAIACIVSSGRERAIRHGVRVARRVMDHFANGGRPFLEQTHVFSYYVVKAAMLVHCDGFIKFLKNQRDGLTPDSGLSVARFMDGCLRSRRFQKAMSEETKKRDMSRGLEMTDGAASVTSFAAIGVLI